MAIQMYKNNSIKINSVADLSIEEARKFADEGIKSVIIFAPAHPTEEEVTERNPVVGGIHQKRSYDIEEYIVLRSKLNELVKGIDPNESDAKKFAAVYKRIGKHIAYDYMAGYPQTENEKIYSSVNVYNCRNLLNGLLNGKCVCAGYADILRASLDLVGIECHYIKGPIIEKDSDKKPEFHAWCKVKIDGRWYNSDPTWDADRLKAGLPPVNALQTDEEAAKGGKEENPGPKCTTEYPTKELNKLFGEKYIGNLKLPNIKSGFKNVMSVYEDIFKNLANKIKSKNMKALPSGDYSFRSVEDGISNKIFLETGFHIIKLIECGFSEEDIIKIAKENYDGHTGEKIDKTERVRKKLFTSLMKKSGYTVDELKRKGLTDDEIIKISLTNFDYEGIEVDKTKLINETITNSAAQTIYNETGYSYQMLNASGFTDHEIFMFSQKNYDVHTGEKLDKKEMVEKRLLELLEEKSGYTIDEMKEKGITDKKILYMSTDNFDTGNGTKIDKKELVKKAIEDAQKKNETKEELPSWDLRNWGIDPSTLGNPEDIMPDQVNENREPENKENGGIEIE